MPPPPQTIDELTQELEQHPRYRDLFLKLMTDLCTTIKSLETELAARKEDKRTKHQEYMEALIKMLGEKSAVEKEGTGFASRWRKK